MTNDHGLYVLPVPTGHRTDWGKALAEALETRLRELRPQHVDKERTGTSRGRGGSLVICVANGLSGEVIQIRAWEDQADVQWRDEVHRFRLERRPNPPNWIPKAVDLVGRLLSENGFV